MTLTLREFIAQVEAYGIEFDAVDTGIEQIIIRSEHADHGLAAVHLDREGTRLVLDLGHKLDDGLA